MPVGGPDIGTVGLYVEASAIAEWPVSLLFCLGSGLSMERSKEMGCKPFNDGAVHATAKELAATAAVIVELGVDPSPAIALDAMVRFFARCRYCESGRNPAGQQSCEMGSSPVCC